MSLQIIALSHYDYCHSFPKYLKKIFNKKLDSFIKKSNILSGNYCGFGAKDSTSLTLIELLENLT